MWNTLARAHDNLPNSDRRAFVRQPIRSLAYVELDEGNGGIVLNISEGGLSVQAVAGLMDDFLPGVRFQLSETESWIEAKARITWTGESRKLAGLEFIDLSDDSRGRIREWLTRELLPVATAEAEDSVVTETQEATTASGVEENVAADQPAAPAPVIDELADRSAEPAGTVVPIAAEPEPNITATSAVLADLLTSVSDHVQPSAPILLSQSSNVKAAGAAADDLQGLISNRWAAAVVLLVLAVGSLAAGWAAGQGQLSRMLARLQGGAAQIAGENRGGFQSTGVAARPSQIDIETASGQRWTIPFNGPLNASTDTIRRAPAVTNSYPPASSSPVPSSQSSKPEAGFRTWILSPPQQTRAAVDGGALPKEAPPEMADNPAANDSVLTPSAGINAQPALQAPPAPTAVVRQGQLIRRVDPLYPSIAKEQGAEGTVRLNVTVGTDGIVRGVSLLGGPRLLVDAAERAVRQWRYTPTLLDGKPVEFQREVDLTFRISSAAR